MKTQTWGSWVLAGLFCGFVSTGGLRASDREVVVRPTLGELMGINGHTVAFKPELYAPTCRRVRDYHPVDWDINGDPAHVTTLPMAANGIDWKAIYGSWEKAGFEVDACLQFDTMAVEKWTGKEPEAGVYAEAFARAMGPSGELKLVTSAEIGNEPAKYSPEEYRAIFQSMAKGLRKGDPRLKIATCAVLTGKPDEWSKPVSAIDGLNDLYDIINVHSYAFASGWPTWTRSFPEDPKIDYLKNITALIKWRDANAKGKPVWLTEFGWDSATHAPAADGPWSKWVGVSDAEQARYIVRSYLVFSTIGIDRAYLYFFDDNDEAQLHGASGITRHFKPKPSYYAMSQLYKNLAPYHFERAVSREEGGAYCFEYRSAQPGEGKIYVAWLATGSDRHSPVDLKLGPDAKRVARAEKMAGSDQPAAKADVSAKGDGTVSVELSESPVYLFVK